MIKVSRTTKKKRKFYTYSSPLTLKQIEYLRDQPNPPEHLRALIDTAIANSIEVKKQKLKELIDMHSLLINCTQMEKGKRRNDCIKRAQAVMKEITALQEEIDL